MTIAHIMTPRNRLLTTSADASLTTLRQVFVDAGYQHVPVIDNTNRLLGIVSVKDYFRQLSPVMEAATDHSIELYIRSRRVHQIMIAPVITVEEKTTIKQAAALLLEHNIGCLPVVDASRHLLGLVSWKDLMRAALGKSVQHNDE